MVSEGIRSNRSIICCYWSFAASWNFVETMEIITLLSISTFCYLSYSLTSFFHRALARLGNTGIIREYNRYLLIILEVNLLLWINRNFDAILIFRYVLEKANFINIGTRLFLS